MRLDDERSSDNVEDRRGSSGGGFSLGSGGGMLPQLLLNLLMRSKYGWLIGILVVVGHFFGFNFMSFLSVGHSAQSASPPAKVSSQEAQMDEFSRKVLRTTERIWGAYFQSQGKSYRAPVLVLYRGATRSACGQGQAAMGPFYCPADQKVYIDLSFYDDMKNQLKAGGDFAFAYVIAHEVGHHVQNLLGISERTQRAQRSVSKKEANQISVAVELQADCFAGVWGHYMKQEDRLENGDVEEAFNAAEAIGDDRLQKQSQGYVVPDSFTHGSSAQRLKWFRVGLESGQPKLCNTVKF